MFRLPACYILVICLPLLLSGCGGDSWGPVATGTVVTNELVVQKTGGNYQEVRHLVLRGTNQEIGKSIAQLSKDYYQATPQQFPDQASKTSRNSYIQQNFPQMAARQRGVEAYYGWGSSDLHDSSALWYEIKPGKCSAVFFPKTVTANGHSFLTRDMDFYTVTISE
ncbi:MAG TPA: hypothetical protein VF799_06155, partial [Geobacteraceae bacterium]